MGVLTAFVPAVLVTATHEIAYIYFMTGLEGEDEVNPVFWLAIYAFRALSVGFELDNKNVR